MKVSHVGAVVITAMDAWEDFRIKNDIIDPRREAEKKNYETRYRLQIINGVPCHFMDGAPVIYDLEKQKEYDDLRRKFMACYIFALDGYDTLLQTDYADMKEYFKPCEDAYRQCSMSCPHFGKINCCKESPAYPSEFEKFFDFIENDLEEE